MWESNPPEPPKAPPSGISTRSVPFASSDIVEAGTTGILSRIPGARQAADAFNTWLDVGRIEFQKAADSRAITAADQRAMTNVVDHMVGAVSKESIAIKLNALLKREVGEIK